MIEGTTSGTAAILVAVASIIAYVLRRLNRKLDEEKTQDQILQERKAYDEELEKALEDARRNGDDREWGRLLKHGLRYKTRP